MNSLFRSAWPTLIPLVAALAVWLSPLAFVPVPWPDDSAFYFVAKDLFTWPPRYVMLPQAPFEPTYADFNFNTMPLFPVLIGLGRFIGIDGSFALKIWPLLAWGLSGSILVGLLLRAGLPVTLAALLALAFGLDPAMRWASVLVRPESLIGLFGMILILGLSLRSARRLKEENLIAALLALAAYTHFNAIHLVFPVALALLHEPRRMIRVGLKTALLLLPWAAVALLKWPIFWRQMTTQWNRLAVGNAWLDSIPNALGGIFKHMGSPEPWPPILIWAAAGIWILILVALHLVVLRPVIARMLKRESDPTGVDLLPSAAWVIAACWLWESKPEEWFTYYIHAAIWCFAGLALLKLWKWLAREDRSGWKWKYRMTLGAFSGLVMLFAFFIGIFALVDVSQALRLGATASWNWKAYHQLVDCIDRRLTHLETALGNPKPFRVWAPTFPDVTIELSRRHPDWALTRTNDFHDRQNLALQHGARVDAVVIPETINWDDRFIEGPQSAYPEVKSVWMNWQEYYLHHLNKIPDWMPNRYLCQVGRWQAFLFMKPGD